MMNQERVKRVIALVMSKIFRLSALAVDEL